MTRPPTFSVVVPCYNYGGYLPACIASIVSQAAVSVDVLIVDDASPDGSADIADSLAAEHPNVSVLRHTVNKGHIATFNDGLDWATNDFVLVLSADDLLAPGALGRVGAAFSANSGVGLVYGPVRSFSEAVPSPLHTGRSTTIVTPGWEWIEQVCVASDNPTISPEVVVRVDIQRTVGHYDARCLHTSDLNMWLRVASMADVARIDGDTQAFYRVHASNMSRTAYKSRLVQIEQRKVAFDAFFETVPSTPNSSRLQSIANSEIARAAISEANWVQSKSTTKVDTGPYAELARSADPSVERQLMYRELQIRRALGPRLSKAFPPFWREPSAGGFATEPTASRSILDTGSAG